MSKKKASSKKRDSKIQKSDLLSNKTSKKVLKEVNLSKHVSVSIKESKDSKTGGSIEKRGTGPRDMNEKK